MQTSTAKRIYRRESEWRDLITKFEQCDLSAADFCNQNGIATSGLYTWRKKFQSVPHQFSDSFIELSALSQPQETDGTPVWDVELELGSGTVLRIRKT